MLIAIVQEVVDKTGRKLYVIEWRLLLPEKRFSIMALRRRWTDDEVRILIKYQDNLKKASKILGRSYGAVRVKWTEIRKTLGLDRKTRVKCVAFPEEDLALRAEVVGKLLSCSLEMRELILTGLKENYTKSEFWEILTPGERIRLMHAVAVLFNCAEKWQTGKEHLEIYKDEKERADQPEDDEDAEAMD